MGTHWRDAAQYRALFARNPWARVGVQLMSRALAAIEDGPDAPPHEDVIRELEYRYGDAGVPVARALEMLNAAERETT